MFSVSKHPAFMCNYLNLNLDQCNCSSVKTGFALRDRKIIILETLWPKLKLQVKAYGSSGNVISWHQCSSSITSTTEHPELSQIEVQLRRLEPLWLQGFTMTFLKTIQMNINKMQSFQNAIVMSRKRMFEFCEVVYVPHLKHTQFKSYVRFVKMCYIY